MDPRVITQIHERLGRLDEKPDLRIGVVTSASPLQISLGGSDPITAAALDGTTYAVNNQVAVVWWKGQPLVLGRIVTAPKAGFELGSWFAIPNFGNASNATPVANQGYYGQVFVPSAATITGLSFFCVGIGTGVSVRSSLYNASGTRVANRSSALACSALTLHKVAFDSAYAAAPGVYFACLTFSAAQGSMSMTLALSPSGTVAGPGAGATPASITPPTALGATIPSMTTY